MAKICSVLNSQGEVLYLTVGGFDSNIVAVPSL